MAELPRGNFEAKELDINLDAKVDANLEHNLDHNIEANVNKTVIETSTRTIEQTVAQTVAATLEHILTANLTHGLNFGGSFKIEGLEPKWGLSDALAIDNMNRNFKHNLLREIQGAVLDHYGDVVEAYHIPLEEYTWLTTMSVIDALDSESATDVLSANQGRVLKEMVEEAVRRLNEALSAEATARQNADTTLQNNINAEATARANGDSALSTALTNHKDSTNPHPNLALSTLSGNLPFSRITGDVPASRVNGKLTNSTIDSNNVNGLTEAIKSISGGNVNENSEGLCYAKFGGLLFQWGSYRLFPNHKNKIPVRDNDYVTLYTQINLPKSFSYVIDADYGIAPYPLDMLSMDSDIEGDAVFLRRIGSPTSREWVWVQFPPKGRGPAVESDRLRYEITVFNSNKAEYQEIKATENDPMYINYRILGLE